MSEYILFKLHNPTGLINQVMSLEIALGIQYITKKEMIIHHMVNQGDSLFRNRLVPIYTPSRWQTERLHRSHIINDDHFPHLLDLIEMPLNQDITFVDELIESICSSENVYDGIENYYFAETEHTADIHFTENRQNISLYDNKKINFKNTLCWYSRFFYNRNKELDSLLNEVKFKTEYTELAKKIATNIGPFNAIHVRLTDHLGMFRSTENMINDSIEFFMSKTEPIVIITDDSEHEFIKKFKKYSNIILLDSFIVNNYSTDFIELPFNDEVIFGLINLLVGTHAKDFIGTSGSTYSGYIHRIINQNRNNTHLFRQTDSINPVVAEPYSWNAPEHKELGNSRKCWWTEWKESYLNV